MTANCEMPKYQCHKQVWALKIKSLSQGVAPTKLPGGSWLLYPEDKRYAAIDVSHEWFSKHNPVAGGYYVVYEDGYKSYSPGEAFESGYKPISGADLPPHQQRVLDEKRELDEKLQKLTAFINSDKFASIVQDDAERGRLVCQEETIRDYSAILGERIAAF